MPTIGRAIQGGPMIRIREDGETSEKQAKRLLRLEREARQAGDQLLAESYEFAAARVPVGSHAVFEPQLPKVKS